MEVRKILPTGDSSCNFHFRLHIIIIRITVIRLIPADETTNGNCREPVSSFSIDGNSKPSMQSKVKNNNEKEDRKKRKRKDILKQLRHMDVIPSKQN